MAFRLRTFIFTDKMCPETESNADLETLICRMYHIVIGRPVNYSRAHDQDPVLGSVCDF